MSGSPISFYTLINSLQLLAYLPLSTIPIPQSLRSLLTSLNMQSFVPNPFLYWVGTSEGPTVPDFATSYGYESCLFLVNCGVMICVGVLVLLYWIAIQALARLPLGILSFYLKEQTKRNQSLRYWLQVYMDVTLAALFQVGWLSFSTFNEAFNSCLGLLIVCLSIVTPFSVLFVTTTFYPNRTSKWMTLFDEFKCKSLRGSLFYTVYLFRRIIYSSVLIFAHTSPKLQAVTFSALSLTVSPT